MELRHLRYFCAVAERLSFTHAARFLHVSQSGVSGQIKSLEREIGAVLLQRTQREVVLTAAGERFYQEAQEILAHAEKAVATAQGPMGGQTGSLTVGLCGPATAPFLPALIREFRKQHPAVRLELKDFAPAEQPAALAQRLIDIGFTRTIPPELKTTLRSTLFFREPLLAALPRDHPLSAAAGLRLSQLALDRLVLYARDASPDLFDALVSFCRRAGFSPRVVASPRVWQTVLTLVEAGEGIALIPASVKYLRSKDILFRRILDRGCSFDVIVAWRRDDVNDVRKNFSELLSKRRPSIEEKMQAAGQSE